MARMARKSVPIFADHTPIEVLFEDDHIIAVNKPAGITSTPAHRHIGSSVLNRLTGGVNALWHGVKRVGCPCSFPAKGIQCFVSRLRHSHSLMHVLQLCCDMNPSQFIAWT